MILREPKNYSDDYCFCNDDITGYNFKNRKVFYPNLPSSVWQVGNGLPVPQVPEVIDDPGLDVSSYVQSDEDGQDNEFNVFQKTQFSCLCMNISFKTDIRYLKLNDLMRDLSLRRKLNCLVLD